MLQQQSLKRILCNTDVQAAQFHYVFLVDTFDIYIICYVTLSKNSGYFNFFLNPWVCIPPNTIPLI